MKYNDKGAMNGTVEWEQKFGNHISWVMQYCEKENTSDTKSARKNLNNAMMDLTDVFRNVVEHSNSDEVVNSTLDGLEMLSDVTKRSNGHLTEGKNGNYEHISKLVNASNKIYGGELAGTNYGQKMKKALDTAVENIILLSPNYNFVMESLMNETFEIMEGTGHRVAW